MAEFYVERQYWTRWPRVLLMCRKHGDMETGNVTVERRRYVPEGGTESEWKKRCRDALGREAKAIREYEEVASELYEARRACERMRAEVDGLKWAVDERGRLIRDMALWMRCPRSCADCEMEGDEGCAFMTRALEMGVEI